MRYEPTPALTLALRRAAELARRRKADVFSARDLLLGLLAEEEGMPFVYIVQAGADAERLRANFGVLEASIMDVGDAEEAESVQASAHVREVLREAQALAGMTSGDGTISTDQILWTLLEADEELQARVIELGANLATLRTLVGAEQKTIEVDDPFAEEPDPNPPSEIGRILDASANRAREALRTLEDFARFALDDARLCQVLKECRHDLVSALSLLPENLLLAGRDVPGDVGTIIATDQESQRHDLRHVVRANSARLQESLRSLEEFGKIVDPNFARQIEAIRYRTYSLESALVSGLSARERLAKATLYVLVTESLCRASLVGTVSEALQGGAQVIQLREKNDDDRTLLVKAKLLRELTRKHDAMLIINDRPDIAKLVDADGVHVGQEDLGVANCRRILGPNAIVGVSTHDLEQVRRAVLEGADYIGVGPVFPSTTKDFAQLAGLEFVRAASQETSLPAFCLGGVTVENLEHVIQAGGRRVAISAAICSVEDPKRVAGAFRRRLG